MQVEEEFNIKYEESEKVADREIFCLPMNIN